MSYDSSPLQSCYLVTLSAPNVKHLVNLKQPKPHLYDMQLTEIYHF